MAVKKSGLGKGLDHYINRHQRRKKQTVNHSPEKRQKEKKKRKVNFLLRFPKLNQTGKQPRKSFDEDALQELADSIKQFGILQPLIVKKKDDYYEIVAGERRWRSCQNRRVETSAGYSKRIQ